MECRLANPTKVQYSNQIEKRKQQYWSHSIFDFCSKLNVSLDQFVFSKNDSLLAKAKNQTKV
jgi:hypothetical protein